MTHHVHLLFTPKSASEISRMVQSLGRKYASYFNHRYKRTLCLLIFRVLQGVGLLKGNEAGPLVGAITK
jgi:REP element-mobilizing transposase RayT